MLHGCCIWKLPKYTIEVYHDLRENRIREEPTDGEQETTERFEEPRSRAVHKEISEHTPHIHIYSAQSHKYIYSNRGRLNLMSILPKQLPGIRTNANVVAKQTGPQNRANT